MILKMKSYETVDGPKLQLKSLAQQNLTALGRLWHSRRSFRAQTCNTEVARIKRAPMNYIGTDGVAMQHLER